MRFIHKGKSIVALPESGAIESISPGRVHFETPIVPGDLIYLFKEDSRSGAKDGGLLARAKISTANQQRNTWRLTVKFDGCRVLLPLLNHQLDGFCRKNSKDTGPFPNPIMTEIAEIRRITTHQPIHYISADCAAWLDIYHFEN